MGYPHFLMRVDFCEEGCDDFFGVLYSKVLCSGGN